AKRQEAEKDERQDVTLVIRWLDASAQGDGGVPEFPKEVAQSAVSAFLFVRRLGFLHQETVSAKVTGLMALPCSWEPAAFSLWVSLLVGRPVTVRQPKPESARPLRLVSLAASLVLAEGLERMTPSV